MIDYISRERDGAVLRVVMNRPEKKNALTDAMYAALTAAFEAATDDADIKVVLITGAGGVFTAGNDIGDFAAVAAGDIEQAERNVHRFLDRLARFPKPVVAAVPGLAVGIGTTMLLHCDYVMLAQDATLSTPFVNLGVVPEAGSSLLLPSCIGHQRAFAMFALGEPVDAGSALAWGLANKVVSSDALDDASRDVARALAARSAKALVATKRLMRDSQGLGRRMAEEADAFAACLRSPEAVAAFKAFAERRRG